MLSKVRSEIGEEKIRRVAESIIRKIYKNRFLHLIVIDSTYLPYWFKLDNDSTRGYATLIRK